MSWLASRCVEVRDQQLDDPLEVGIGQRVEDDDLVDAVEELGPEVRRGAPR